MVKTLESLKLIIILGHRAVVVAALFAGLGLTGPILFWFLISGTEAGDRK